MTTRRSARVYRLIGAVGTNRLVTRLHPVAYRVTGGRGPWIGEALGMRQVILETTGRTSGRRIDVPLFAAPDGERLVIVGSNGGKAKDPAWVGNLRASPEITVRAGKRTLEMTAREVEGEERERLWAIAAAGFPGYDLYAKRTAGVREIAVFALEPRA
jgi:deazaflavin-dependent oxidoreductase (nitroreductase family)